MTTTIVSIAFPVSMVLLAVLAIYKLYEHLYFSSKKFLIIKSQIQKYVYDCNDLNQHIENLKNSHIGVNQLDFGKATYQDNSRWNYKRPELKNQHYAANIYNCSRSVCDSARKQPYKYVCKYFNLTATEETLESVENVLNNFEAAEQGKIALKAERDKILNSVKSKIPKLIKFFSKKKLELNLGFEYIDFSSAYFPKYMFKYISPGGNASMQCDITMDIENLNKFINYLAGIIKFRNSVAGQRALMTSSLRQKILRRDNHTCAICGISTHDEQNLLLEIDHIIPLSKGGMTSESNLRVLCWRCNRKKGAKIEALPNDIMSPTTKDYKRLISVLVQIKQIAEKEDGSTITQSENIVQPMERFEKGILDNTYGKENGFYPSGQYLVGKDIPLGGYILSAQSEKAAYIALYPDYTKYKKKEDAITCHDFTENYHISLMEENSFMVVENAVIGKI